MLADITTIGIPHLLQNGCSAQSSGASVFLSLQPTHFTIMPNLIILLHEDQEEACVLLFSTKAHRRNLDRSCLQFCRARDHEDEGWC